MKSRVFIGNLPYEKVTKEELEAMFSKYGKILGMLPLVIMHFMIPLVIMHFTIPLVIILRS